MKPSSLLSLFLTLLNYNIVSKGVGHIVGKDSTTMSRTAPDQIMKMVPAKLAHRWATVSSTIASFLFVWAIVSQYLLPHELQRIIQRFRRQLKDYFNTCIQITIHEFAGDKMKRSEAYTCVESYLSSKTSKTAKKFKAEMETENGNLVVSLDECEEERDEFGGAKLWWVSGKFAPVRSSYSEQRFYRVKFDRKYMDIVTKSYLHHVIREGREIRKGNRQRRIYTNNSGYKWSHTVFEHPANFETIAMDEDKKREIVEDLLAFTKGRDYYARIGKAWKRGYLLYGPPGTGKSTMVAAMANLLNYDVYDLELTAVFTNTELRRLLLETSSKSIIVIEDIDCSVDFTGQRKKKIEPSCLRNEDKWFMNEKKEHKEEGYSSTMVTLSGLLNLIDGLWSSCGSERLIVFTTNHVEKLDPALIRRGRMDKHIEMSYCSFNGFKVLAKNYLNVENHVLFERIETLMKETKITPADVAENLMPKSFADDPEKCLSNFIQVLEKETEKASASKNAEKSSENQAPEGIECH